MHPAPCRDWCIALRIHAPYRDFDAPEKDRGPTANSLMLDEQHERRLARGLRDGKIDAWQALYDAFAERVWRGVARLLGGNGADVADVVQETMLAAAKSALSFDPERGSLWLWLW